MYGESVSFEHVHRMLVGGPLDNKIVYVQENVDPYQVHIYEQTVELVPRADLVTGDITSTIGRYYLDKFVSGFDFNKHTYYRWEDWSRKLAAKIYMRRMGMSSRDILTDVEWHGWGE